MVSRFKEPDRLGVKEAADKIPAEKESKELWADTFDRELIAKGWCEIAERLGFKPIPTSR
jgi:hypothetical protein